METRFSRESGARHLVVLVLLASGLCPASVLAADLVCSSPQTLSAPSTYDTVTVQNGCVLTVNAPLTVNANMTIQSGGVVTHGSRLVAGLALNVTGTLDVQAGGLIDLDEKGLLGGSGGSAFGLNGEAFSTADAIVSGALGGQSGGGGSYGGQGASGFNTGLTNPPYGLPEDPRHLGAGGGASSSAPGLRAGHGGGRLTINAGSCVVNGTVKANGGTTSFTGGGSGGAIRMNVGSLSGTGVIQARGGGSGSNAGAGSGGRIAVYYGTLAFPEASLSVRGGSTGSPAAAGTIYLKDNAVTNGDLIVDNSGGVGSAWSTPLRTALTAFRSLKIRNLGRLTANATEVAAFTVEQPVVLASGGELALNAGVTMGVTNASGFDVQVPTGTSISLNAGSALNADTIRVNGGFLTTSIDLSFPAGNAFELSGGGALILFNNSTFGLGVFDTSNIQGGFVILTAGSRLNVASGGATLGSGVTLIKDGAFGASGDVIGSLTIQSGGVMTHSSRLLAGLALNVTGTLDVQTGGLIDLDEKGLQAGGGGSAFGLNGEAFDATDVIVSGAQGGQAGGGGSYGGQGANGFNTGLSNPPYGLLEDPRHLGAGGGASSSAPGLQAGHGGGRLTINAGSCVVNGTVRANGGTRTFTGGGSGGAIRVNAASLSGAGVIQARGGGSSSNGGAGGGGRIAVYYGTLTLSDANISARGGNAGTPGGAGTVYLKDNAQANGDLIIDNAGVASGLITPLRTALAAFHSLKVRGNQRLEIASSVVPALSLADLLIDGPTSLIIVPPRDIGGLRINIATSLVLQNGGRILVESGLRGGGGVGNIFGNAGETLGPDGVTPAQGSTGGSGGTYGGLGGGPAPNPVYGIPEDPRQVGSGGSRTAASGAAGDGGGHLWISAATCSVPAGTSVLAPGGGATAGSGTQGGGSGGSVKLDCPTITGAGTIAADGGCGAGTNGNGGGGGRVALRTNTNNFTGALRALGGCATTGSGQAGQVGTVFIGDLVPPRVTGMRPFSGTTLLTPLSLIEVSFSENLYAAGVTASHVLLSGAATGAHVPSAISFDTGTQGLNIEFNPPLPQDSYTLTLVSGEGVAGLSDASLNALDGECPGGSGPDCERTELPSGDGIAGGDFLAFFDENLAPAVTQVDPANNALGVPEASNVSVAFSEPVDPSTVNGSTLRLLKNGAPVPAVVALATSGTRAVLDPTSPLELNTLYQVEVTSGVRDLTGRTAVPFSSLFRTTTVGSGTVTLPSVSDQAPGLGPLSKAGHAVAAAGDLNQDGLKDFLAGAPAYQASGGPVEGGAAAVYLGSGGKAERQSPDIVFLGASAHDRAGVAVAGKFDFNGDGITDILVGAEQVNRTPDNDPAAGCNAGQACGPGKVYLIYFNPSDAVHYPHLADPATPDIVSLSLVGQPGGIPGVVFTGASLGSKSGFAVAGGGKVKGGSNREAIAIGAPGKTVTRSVPGPSPQAAPAPLERSADAAITAAVRPQTDVTLPDAGTVYVIFGDPALSGSIDLSRVADGQADEIAGVVYEGQAPGDQLGFSVAFPGDVMGTIGDDLALGAPYADPVLPGTSTPVVDAGIAYVVQGGALTTSTVNVADIGFAVDGTQVLGDQAGMQAGFAVAGGGDQNADGDADLLIGAPRFDDDIRLDCGLAVDSTRRIYGGTMQTSAIGFPSGTSTCTVPGVQYRCVAAGDQLGYAVAGVGDVTGDGFDDIALGAPNSDPVIGGQTVVDAGTVYLIDGAPAANTCRGSQSMSDVGGAIAGQQLVGTTTGELAGSSLAGTGDLSGDGYNDFVVGAPLKDVGGDQDAGTVYEVVDAHSVLPGVSTPDGFTVTDLYTGASLQVLPGGLDSGHQVEVMGMYYPTVLPAPPAGGALAGASGIMPVLTLGTVAGDAAHLIIPLHPLYQGAASTLRLRRYDGGVWVDTGIDGAIVPNPTYPQRAAVMAALPGGALLTLYAVFAPDGDGDGAADFLDNCRFIGNPSQTDGDSDGVGDACDNCPSVPNPTQSNIDADAQGDACDSCASDPLNDGDNDGYCAGPGFLAPKLGDNDNCPQVPNPGQADTNGNGIGDACEGACSVTVDQAGTADFTHIQAAVDALFSLGFVTCQVNVRDGTYSEDLTLGAPVLIAAAGPGVPVIQGSGAGPVISIPSGAGGGVRLSALDLRGGTKGVSTSRQLELSDVTITQVAAGGVGLEVLSGTTTMRGGRIEIGGGDPASVGVRVSGSTSGSLAAKAILGSAIPGAPAVIRIKAPGGTGVDVAPGKSADLGGVDIRGAATGVRAGGSVTLSSTLIASGSTGIFITPDTGAHVDASFVTVAGNTVGVTSLSNSAAALRFASGIAWGNSMDLSGMATCSQVFASDEGSADCTAAGNPNRNLSLDPLFLNPGGPDPWLRDYHPAPSSLLDNATAGVTPRAFAGVPCHDLDNAPRLRDANGDGLAVSDLGAYEAPRFVPGPGEVLGFVMQNKTTLSWSVETSAATYTILRGAGGTGGAALGYCLPATVLQSGTAATTLPDATNPPAGGFYYYLVQAVDGMSRAGTLGDGTCAERSRADFCPAP